MEDYQKKYIKYKTKYLQLLEKVNKQAQIGGVRCPCGKRKCRCPGNCQCPVGCNCNNCKPRTVVDIRSEQEAKRLAQLIQSELEDQTGRRDTVRVTNYTPSMIVMEHTHEGEPDSGRHLTIHNTQTPRGTRLLSDVRSRTGPIHVRSDYDPSSTYYHPLDIGPAGRVESDPSFRIDIEQKRKKEEEAKRQADVKREADAKREAEDHEHFRIRPVLSNASRDFADSTSRVFTRHEVIVHRCGCGRPGCRCRGNCRCLQNCACADCYNR